MHTTDGAEHPSPMSHLSTSVTPDDVDLEHNGKAQHRAFRTCYHTAALPCSHEKMSSMTSKHTHLNSFGNNHTARSRINGKMLPPIPTPSPDPACQHDPLLSYAMYHRIRPTTTTTRTNILALSSENLKRRIFTLHVRICQETQLYLVKLLRRRSEIGMPPRRARGRESGGEGARIIVSAGFLDYKNETSPGKQPNEKKIGKIWRLTFPRYTYSSSTSFRRQSVDQVSRCAGAPEPAPPLG